MADINLKILLSITPMASETKEKLMAILDEMDEDKKMQLNNLCWNTLADLIEIRYKKENAKLQQEITEGKRIYNSNDFTEARTRIIHELTEKIEIAATDEELLNIRN